MLAASTVAPAAVSAAPAVAASLKDKHPCSLQKAGSLVGQQQVQPEDVRANLGRLAALIVPRNRLAIAGPSGSSGKRKFKVFVV